MPLSDIPGYIESVEKFIRDLAIAIRERRWIKISTTAGVAFAVFLNPPTFEYLINLLGYARPEWYSYLVWVSVTGLIFGLAILLALLTKEKAFVDSPPAISIIKGLLPYTNTKEDAEWFSKLQRGHILQDSLTFCRGEDHSFGILNGESGTGKTSFLQAGLVPNLETLGYRPVYVKLTDTAPLESICRALNTSKNGRTDGQSLSGLLAGAENSGSRPITLILDQFEQFFVHNKTKSLRKAFVAQLTEWNRNNASLRSKILISIRGDYLNRMGEFQKEMKYALTPYNNLSLEKFEPIEAANVLRVIADEAKISLDESFIKELTIDELADREDGTVSPIDIQILSRMVEGQKNLEERAFDRKAFQKLGGVEGLLERFLNSTLNALGSDSRRQSAIKVMLALTDGGLRLGASSLKDLRERLSNVIPEGDIEEAVTWLTRADIRLVTPIYDKGMTVYELAHERLIPPLRRMASKEITEIEHAEQLLDRRVNEWLGNNRARRYLLTFKEWRLIRRNAPLIRIGSQKEQKARFIGVSRARFGRLAASFGASVLLAIAGYYGYSRYQQYNQWYEQQPERRIARAQEQLIELLGRNKDVVTTGYAITLLAAIDDEKNVEFPEKLWERIGDAILAGEGTVEKSRMMGTLAERYLKMSKAGNALKRIEAFVQRVDKKEELPAEAKVNLVTQVAIICKELLSQPDVALNYLNVAAKIVENAENLETAEKFRLLGTLAEIAHSELSRTDEAVGYLATAWRLAEPATDLKNADKIELLVLMGSICQNKFSRTDDALKYWNIAAQIIHKVEDENVAFLLLEDLAAELKPLSKTEAVSAILDKIKEERDRVVKVIEDKGGAHPSRREFGDGRGIGSGTGDGSGPGRPPPISKENEKLIATIKSSEGVADTRERQKILDRVLHEIGASFYRHSDVVKPLVDAYASLPTTDAVDSMDKVYAAARYTAGDDLLIKFIDSFGKLGDTEKSAAGLARIWKIANEKCRCTAKIPLLMAFEQNYKNLPKTEEVIQNSAAVRQKIEDIQPSLEKYFQDKRPSDNLPRNISIDAPYLIKLSELYVYIESFEKAEWVLSKARETAGATRSSDDKNLYLLRITDIYTKLNKWPEALDTVQLTGSEIMAVLGLSKILIAWNDEQNGTNHMDMLDEFFLRELHRPIV